MSAVSPICAAVTLRVNGEEHSLELDTRTSLLDVLREQLGLTGAKKGCDHGQCGACTVLLDGRRANACLMLAITLEGREVTTIEGLADGEELHPVQAAFVEHDAFQCGYCTPGQICSAVGIAGSSLRPTHGSPPTSSRVSPAVVTECRGSAPGPTHPRVHHEPALLPPPPPGTAARWRSPCPPRNR